MHILLVEDQAKLAENMKRYLALEGYDVTVTHDGKNGLELAKSMQPDVMILDINLPGMDGYTVCAHLRSEGVKLPILMLTARTKQQEVVHGLNIGADDYLKKPFDLEELSARITALLRRSPQSTKTGPLSSGDITLNPDAMTVTKKGKHVSLSPKEFALLEHLLRHRDHVQDRPSIIEAVWGGDDSLLFSQTVDVHVAYIRKKLGKGVIETVAGKGYVIRS